MLGLNDQQQAYVKGLVQSAVHSALWAWIMRQNNRTLAIIVLAGAGLVLYWLR